MSLEPNCPMITPAQMRAARGMMDWSRSQCSKIVGVSAETVKNIEQGKFNPTKGTIEKILSVFSDHGVEFFTQHGVSMKQKTDHHHFDEKYAEENE